MSARKYVDKLRKITVRPLEPHQSIWNTSPVRQAPSYNVDERAAVQEIRKEMTADHRRRADSVMGPDVKKAKRTKAKKAVAVEISARLYETPNGARHFGESVVEGGLGTFLTWVYLMGSGGEGPIKIGLSDDPARRLIGLQTGQAEELHLLCALSGDADTEKFLHGVFAPDHLRGEWFKRSPQLLEFARVVGIGARKPPPQREPQTRRVGATRSIGRAS